MSLTRRLRHDSSGSPTMMRTAVFSIISPNARHFARVLMASVQRVHPEWDRFVLIAGEIVDSDHGEEPFTGVGLDALRLPAPRPFCFRYTRMELHAAVRPWMFESLFDRGYNRVIYFDADTCLYGPLVEIDAAREDTFLTLLPQAGAVNRGFLVVSRHPALARFLAWWQEQVEVPFGIDAARWPIVDQRWMDLVPGLFPDVAILDHEGYGVAPWNLRQRRVDLEGRNARVNGQPLRFFHFSGVDPGFSERVSKYDTLRTTDVGDAATLIEDYCDALRVAGHASFKNARDALQFFADGSPVPDAARIAYRQSAALQAMCGSDPYEHSDVFRKSDDARSLVRAKKIVQRSYSVLSGIRPLVYLIPRGLRRKLRETLLGRRETASNTMRNRSLPPGLNIVGYATRDTGVAESARLCQKACEAAGLSSDLMDVDSANDLQRATYRASLYHVNADQTPDVHRRLARVFDASAYNIACWHWELPQLPDEWVAAASLLDEIWAPSTFIQSAISRKVSIPVLHMPHGIEVTSKRPCSPEELGVPHGRFTFLCMFDLTSITRKNPLGAVEAFRRAFPEPSAVALLIKAGQSERHRERFADLQERLRGIPNVYLTNQMLSRPRVNGLVAACDAVVSLHRSEGFGLIPAEAMSRGKPVLATGWSGNTDFMNADNSCLVDYELVTIDTNDAQPFGAGQQWAEPNLDHAARLMRRVVEDSDYRKQVGERARHTIQTQFSAKAAGLRYVARLNELGLMGR